MVWVDDCVLRQLGITLHEHAHGAHLYRPWIGQPIEQYLEPAEDARVGICDVDLSGLEVSVVE
jgi:hypothetical protein